MNPPTSRRLAVQLLSLLFLSSALHGAPPGEANPIDQQRDWESKQQLQDKIDRELEEQRRRAARQKSEQKEQKRQAGTPAATDDTEASPAAGQSK